MVKKRALIVNKSLNTLTYITALFSILLMSLFARTYAGQPLQGDQPHYVIMANSLIRQGDLNLKDDYTRKLYQPILHIEDIDAHINFGLVNPASERWYSIHSPGLAIIIAPVLAIAGLRGVLLLMAMAGTALCVLTYLWSMHLTKNKVASLLSIGALLFSVMYLNLTGYVFVDVPIACLLVASILALHVAQRKSQSWLYILIGTLAALNVWLHVKTGLMMGSIILLALYQIYTSKLVRREKLINAARLLVPFSIIFLLLCLQVHRWFGVWLPNQIYQGNGQLLQLSPLDSVSAIMFDSFKGILTPNPAFLLIFSGLPIWWRVHKRSLAWVLLIIVPSFLIQSTFIDWAGGWSPAGRYPIEWLPLFIPAISFSLIYIRSTLGRVIQAVLLGVGVFLGMAYIFLRIPWIYAGMGSPLFERLRIINLLPRFDADATMLSGSTPIIAMIILSAGLYVLGLKASKRIVY